MYILIIFLIALLMVVLNCFLYFLDKRTNYDTEFPQILINIVGGIFIGILLIAIVATACDLASEEAISKKIIMYQEENTNIDNQMSQLVQRYMDYEKETYMELKPGEGVELISLYPELKTDTLVVKQLEIYSMNMEQIKALKSKLIDFQTNKWLLYFGR